MEFRDFLIFSCIKNPVLREGKWFAQGDSARVWQGLNTVSIPDGPSLL